MCSTNKFLKEQTFRIFNTIEEVLIFLTSRIGLLKYKQKIDAIKDILFIKKTDSYFNKHFKFDFSFSLSKPNLTNLRFTYNDYNEEHIFKQKIIAIFNLFKDYFDIKKINQILDFLRSPLTFGIDWHYQESVPKLKVYSEMSNSKDYTILSKKICEKINIDFEKVSAYLKGPLKICAICIDFSSKDRYDFKVYIYFDGISDCSFLTTEQINRISNFQNNLFFEKDSFFLGSYGFSGDSRLQIFKCYKIYNTKEYQLASCRKEIFHNRYKEIESLLKNYRINKTLDRHLKDLKKISMNHNTLIYPIAISLKLIPQNCNYSELGIYLSVI